MMDIQQLFNGLFIGSIYALFAIGFTLVFGILDKLNLAHPAVFAVGAFAGIELVQVAGLPIWVALPVVFVICGLLGLVIERVAFRPLKGRSDAHFAGLISSIAMAGKFIALLQWRYGPDTRRFPAGSFPEDRFAVLGAQVTLVQVVILGICLVLVAALSLLVSRSRWGRGMRAVAENPAAAQVLGVNVDRVTSLTLAISSALGAVARSEEHTSELQSRGHLVCRLLLEKKKDHFGDEMGVGTRVILSEGCAAKLNSQYRIKQYAGEIERQYKQVVTNMLVYRDCDDMRTH